MMGIDKVTVVYNRSDGFCWVKVPGHDAVGDLPPHYFASLQAAVERARELGFWPTHWMDPNVHVLVLAPLPANLSLGAFAEVIMDAVLASSQPLSISEISKATGLSQRTCIRKIKRLVRREFLIRVGTGPRRVEAGPMAPALPCRTEVREP